jgi:hypothetical protein
VTELELQQLRREKWRLDGRAIRTLEDARDFIDSVGFCLMYPERQPVLVPTFIGAYAGSDEKLPTWQHSFADPRAKEATELMVRLLRDKSAFEANLFGENVFLVSASVFPYFYGLVGDRNPRQLTKASGRSTDYSPLAREVFEAIRKQGATTKQKLQNALGGALSPAALDRALGELWSRLRITRVDYLEGEGAYWDTLFRWAPDAVREGMQVSVPEALSALVSKYLDCVVAAEQTEVAEFFGHYVPRSKVNEAVRALMSARELSFVPVDNRSNIQVTPPRPEIPVRSPRPQRTPRPPRPQGR